MSNQLGPQLGGRAWCPEFGPGRAFEDDSSDQYVWFIDDHDRRHRVRLTHVTFTA